MCTGNPGAGAFQVASTVSVDTEDLLTDGAIDQTYAFSRTSHIQLNAAKIEMTDKLANDIPNPEEFFVQTLVFVQKQMDGVCKYFVDEKGRQALNKLSTSFNVMLS